MNYVDLFSGIGGFAYGAWLAGMKFDKHYFSEVEPFAVELYQKRFPDAIPLGDITKIKTEDLPNGEYIITGGFPCQDISIAGKGAGITGERSGLWFEYRRLINDLRPRFSIMENVGMLIHRGLREVLGSLTEIGYNAEWQTIRACQLGLSHQRERVWIIAYPESKHEQYICERGRSSLKLRKCFRGNVIDKSEIKSFAGREDDGISGDMDRLKGLGNAIVPQIAELLFRQIKDI